jgi:hypothetical protein
MQGDAGAIGVKVVKALKEMKVAMFGRRPACTENLNSRRGRPATATEAQRVCSCQTADQQTQILT